MKIASNFEITNKEEMLKARIKKGEKIATWSVQAESNSYADDMYNGTKTQCLTYAKKHKRIDDEIQIALMSLVIIEDFLCTDYCYELEQI